MNLIQFHPEHLKLMDLKPIERRLLDIGVGDVLDRSGSAHTMIIDGRVVCVYGFLSMFPGVIRVMVIPSVYVYQHPHTVVRYALTMLKRLEETVKPHRIETYAYDSPDIEKWMRVLGFELEGKHKNWSTDKDTFCTWARFPKQ